MRKGNNRHRWSDEDFSRDHRSDPCVCGRCAAISDYDQRRVEPMDERFPTASSRSRRLARLCPMASPMRARLARRRVLSVVGPGIIHLNTQSRNQASSAECRRLESELRHHSSRGDTRCGRGWVQLCRSDARLLWLADEPFVPAGARQTESRRLGICSMWHAIEVPVWSR
jgi:hypothetical protein